MNLEDWDDYTEEDSYDCYDEHDGYDVDEFTKLLMTPQIFKEKDKDKGDGCIKTIGKHVQLAADVTITPRVSIVENEIDACRINDWEICQHYGDDCHKYCHTEENKCTFTIRQDLFVKIPLIFEVDVHTKTLGINCDPCNIQTIHPDHCK